MLNRANFTELILTSLCLSTSTYFNNISGPIISALLLTRYLVVLRFKHSVTQSVSMD